jgi:hypothetical protein
MPRQALPWICSGLAPQEGSPCIDRLGEINNASQPWTICSSCIDESEWMPSATRWPVDYCLSERAESRCQLHFNVVMAVIVTVLNFLKAALMFYIVYSIEDNPLMTIGDAVASFLDEKDHATERTGLLSIIDIRRGYSVGPSDWEDRRRRWKDTTSIKRLTTAFILYSIRPTHSVKVANTCAELRQR